MTDEPLDDFEALVSRAVQGEVEALTQLLAGQQAWLAKFVSTRLDRRLAARLDVGDIVQDVLVEAAGRLPEYLEHSAMPFTEWIKKIAFERMTYVHRVHVKAEKRSVRREVQVTSANGWSSEALLADHPRSRDKTPSSFVAGKELYNEAAKLMQQLPENYQVLLRLRFIEQRSVNEVALMMGITERALRMKQLRALRQLRDLLEPSGPGDEVL